MKNPPVNKKIIKKITKILVSNNFFKSFNSKKSENIIKIFSKYIYANIYQLTKLH